MYGAVDSIGGKGSNPFVSKPGTQSVGNNNPFTANKSEDKTGFDPQTLFNSGTVGLKQDTPELQKVTLGIA